MFGKHEIAGGVGDDGRRLGALDSLMSVTVAPGTTAPCASLTVPETVPVTPCAASGTGETTSTKACQGHGTRENLSKRHELLPLSHGQDKSQFAFAVRRS